MKNRLKRQGFEHKIVILQSGQENTHGSREKFDHYYFQSTSYANMYLWRKFEVNSIFLSQDMNNFVIFVKFGKSGRRSMMESTPDLLLRV